MKANASAQADLLQQNHAQQSTPLQSVRCVDSFDSRPHAITQRRFQENANSSVQAMQLQSHATKMAASTQAVQLHTLSSLAANLQASNAPSASNAQGNMATSPLQRVEDDEVSQGKFDTVDAARTSRADTPSIEKPNNTGLPNQLKAGIESLSGLSLDHVRVHYNSEQPAQLNAHAYAQGSDIHVAPGQERHLPHEAWHVVQQAQGRVRATTQMKGAVLVNDDVSLETEADVMGAQALGVGQLLKNEVAPTDDAPMLVPVQRQAVVQRLAGMEVELRIPFYGNGHGVGVDNASFISPNEATLNGGERQAIVDFLYGGLAYGLSYGAVATEYDISADHTGWLQTHWALRSHIDGTHITDPGDKPSMSNLEYRTEALEERDSASQARMASIADHIKTHAQDAAAKGVGGVSTNLNAPVAALQTGIPVAALRKLLVNDAPGLALFDTMNNALDPSLYFQTTVGTLPSEVPTLFNEAAADIEARNPLNNNVRATAKSTVLRQAVLLAQQAMGHGNSAALRGLLNPSEQIALTGWLTLVAQTLLSWQLETTSLRYAPGVGGRLQAGAGTTKNLLPYLPKTAFLNTILALPLAAQPDVVGVNSAAWLGMLVQFRAICDPATTDLVTALGLVDYDGQDHFDDLGVVAGVVGHVEVLGNQTPGQWLTGVLRGEARGNAHVRSGRMLGLDAGQAGLAPGLSVPGQEAIPLEDRASQVKQSFGNSRNFAGLDAKLVEIWNLAKNRRMGSSTAVHDYGLLRPVVLAKLNAYGNLRTILPALATRQQRFDALPAVAPADGTVLEAIRGMMQLDADTDTWGAALSNDGIALSLMRPLLLKANWSTKGEAWIGTKVPRGVDRMRTALSAGNNAGVTLANLRNLAVARLGAGERLQVVTDMYELARDTPGWMLAGGAANWNLFVAKYNATNNAV